VKEGSVPGSNNKSFFGDHSALASWVAILSALSIAILVGMSLLVSSQLLTRMKYCHILQGFQ
jgi:hypothetical protein